MALVSTCPRCRQLKVVDPFCGDVCFSCLDKFPDLGHRPDCRVALGRQKEKLQRISAIHKMIAEQRVIVNKAFIKRTALEATLREIDPCSHCQGVTINNCCHHCDGTGYNPKPSEEELNRPLPPPTYGHRVK